MATKIEARAEDAAATIGVEGDGIDVSRITKPMQLAPIVTTLYEHSKPYLLKTPIGAASGTLKKSA